MRAPEQPEEEPDDAGVGAEGAAEAARAEVEATKEPQMPRRGPAAEADVDRMARASASAGAPLADIQSLAEASGDLLPPEPEPKLAPRETVWTRLSRAILLLLLVAAASVATGSYLLHQTLDPRPFLQELMDLLMKP